MTFQRHIKTILASAAISSIIALNAHSQDITFTEDADFQQGSLSSLEYDPITGALVLSDTGSTFPVLWVANAGEDSVSRIDTDIDCETARYPTWIFTNFHGAYNGPAPSRTAVDVEGNVYVANRHFDGRPASVMKILAEGGIDRNGNGVIDTSIDANGDCTIDRNDPAEFTLPVDLNSDGILQNNEIVDERIAWVSQVGPNGGLGRSLCIAVDGNIWVGLFNVRQYFQVDSSDGTVLNGPYNSGSNNPYGCLVDGDGILWSATLSSTIAVLDTNLVGPGEDPFLGNKDIGASGYGIALANDKVYLGRSGNDFNEYDPNAAEDTAPANDGDPLTGIFTRAAGFNFQLGISADGDGNLISGSNTVIKTAPDGTRLWSTPNPTSTSVGVAIDSNQNVWVMGLSSNNVAKFDGATGNQLLLKTVGRNPYTYSDSTGFAARNITDRTGIWNVIADSSVDGAQWDSISWNEEAEGNVPDDASIRMRYRVSDDENSLQFIDYADATNGATGLNAQGRFVQLRVELRPNGDDETPLLSDVSINAVEDSASCDLNADSIVDRFDLNMIRMAAGPAGPEEPADIDRNGVVDRTDMRKCVVECTFRRCASN